MRNRCGQNIEIEFKKLGFCVFGFHTHKLSSLNLIFMSHPCPIHLTVMWVLSWKSSLLNSISVNGPQHSTCCRGSQLGTCFLFVHLTISQIEHSTPCTLFSFSQFSSSQHSILSECTLHSSLHYSQIEHSLHYTHLTQHFRYTIFYLLVFFC